VEEQKGEAPIEEINTSDHADQAADEGEGLVELDYSLYDLEKAKETKDQANEIVKSKGDMTEAIRMYKTAIELCPPDEKVEKAIFHNNLGIALNKFE